MSTNSNSLTNQNNAAIVGLPNLPVSIPAKPEPYPELPALLKQYPNWVGWKLIEREGKLTKVPFNVLTGTHAKANDPTTWTTFEQVLEATEFPNDDIYAGIGFELHGTNIVGIDFDNAITSKGVIDPYALAILALLDDPYCEVSPSGKGLHAFVECDALPEGGRKMSQGHTGIEIYHGREGGRYFTVTGKRVLGDGIPKIDDIRLPYFLISQSRDEKFKKLWTGDISNYPSPSEADLALISMLARRLNNDAKRIEKYFGASKLGQREKWQRPDYRKSTIDKAISGKDSNATPATAEYESISGTADQVTPKKIVWLWPNRFAQKLNLIVGNPDLGKGLITYYIAACCTTGRAWFDATNTMEPSEVLLLNGEEDWDDTVVPRLMAAGADRSKVRWLKMSATKNGKITEKELQLDRDITTLENFLEEHPAIRLVVVDPISNYLGSAKMIDEQRVREVLTPLKDIANRRRVAIIGVMHLNKKVELDAIHRIGGAMAFVGVARMVWLVAPKPAEDATDSDELLMVKVKGNIVQRKLKGLSFTTKVHYVPIEGDDVAAPYVAWIGDVDKTANEVTGRPQKPAHRPAEQLPACVAWLRGYLKDGARLLDDIVADGKTLYGFNGKMIQRARDTGGVITFSSGKTKARDGKMRTAYSCRLSVQDAAQINEENQGSF
jgi:AAA domain-containing protein/primase/DNA polymerase family protein